jgi:hypothetical protein
MARTLSAHKDNVSVEAHIGPRVFLMPFSRMKVLEWQPLGHVIPPVVSLRSFFSLGACSCKLQHAEQQNLGILHTHSEPSATFNMSHMLPVTLDSNRKYVEKLGRILAEVLSLKAMLDGQLLSTGGHLLVMSHRSVSCPANRPAKTP